jgi:hypothetical protein
VPIPPPVVIPYDGYIHHYGSARAAAARMQHSNPSSSSHTISILLDY